MENAAKDTLTLVIPCYNEERTLRACVERCLKLENSGVNLELVIVDDCSADASAQIAGELAAEYPQVKLISQPRNMGKGAALRRGFEAATGDFVGVQDADSEYNPEDYLKMLEPMRSGLADVVFGSRYLSRDNRRVLYFWHTLMNRALTFLSNMFTNLDITDMETCYKLFTRAAIKQIAPLLKENRFGFEPEVTELVARLNFNVYECAIYYQPRTYQEGKKIGWKDGARALYCILHYGAPYAPLPMQAIIYFFIGLVCAIANIAIFSCLIALGVPLTPAVVSAFVLAAALNYLLCMAILFRHKARWSAKGEVFAYVVTVVVMCLLDWVCTYGFVALGVNPVWAKAWSALIGFAGNFLLRKYYVF